jgi:hypothetical protein
MGGRGCDLAIAILSLACYYCDCKAGGLGKSQKLRKKKRAFKKEAEQGDISRITTDSRRIFSSYEFMFGNI